MTPEENYADITAMQAEWQSGWRDKRRWIIVETACGYEVHEHSRDSVAPVITKPNKREAAARLLQCLGIGPVAPQSHPEEMSVGTIDYKSADILPLTR